MKTTIILAAAALSAMQLAACTTAHEMVGPDGKPGFAVACNGTANGWDACYTKAHNACGGPYTVLSTGGDSWRTRTINVECGKS